MLSLIVLIQKLCCAISSTGPRATPTLLIDWFRTQRSTPKQVASSIPHGSTEPCEISFSEPWDASRKIFSKQSVDFALVQRNAHANGWRSISRFDKASAFLPEGETQFSWNFV